MSVKESKKGQYSYTPEQLKARIKQTRDSVKEIKELYERFMEKKTLKDIIGIIGNIKMIHSYTFRNLANAYIEAEYRKMKDYVGILNSYPNWKKLGYYVKKGEKGLRILYPKTKKYTEIDEETGEEIEKTRLYFGIGHTFDISQTTAMEDYIKEQQEKDKKIYTNIEIDYEKAIEFLKSNFKEVNLIEDIRENETKGTYNEKTQTITTYQRKSHTIFHELGHHATYKLDLAHKDWRVNESSYAKDEIQAELFSYILSKKFNENAEYNFNYSNIWSNRILDCFELKEFEHAYKTLVDFIEKLNFN